MSTLTPRYPIYVISKGRSDRCLTARFLIKDNINFNIVIEPQERELYAREFGNHRLLTLPFSNLGLGSIPARNWCWEHAKASGYKRHWIVDDNIMGVHRRWQSKKIPCDSHFAFHVAEEFTDRYENIAITGFNYYMFLPDGEKHPPFVLNCHVYSCMLINNSLIYRWRGRYNEDTDLCLQVLSGGWCTVLINAFAINKMTTMTMRGGNTDDLYKGDGRLKMARSLQRMWPNVVTTKRRFRRPQHVVKDAWKRFDTPLKLKQGINLKNMQKVNEYGMHLAQIKPIKSEKIKSLLREYQNKHLQEPLNKM